jgi:sarcosine oxidase
MGSAAAYHLTRAGQKVLGLDQYTPPHAFGSSHGQTRIIREAYFEHPSYVPLVQRAYELWAELEERARKKVFLKTGGLMIGPEKGVVFSGARRSAQEHHLAHEILDRNQLRERFPMFRLTEPMNAVWEPRAGVLFPELCVEAHLTLARQSEAELHYNEKVRGWSATGKAVKVWTDAGTYTARQMLCTAGAWIQQLMLDALLPLQVERQVLYWFEPRARKSLFQPDGCPVYIVEFERERFFYGFPDLGAGVKVARHHEGLTTTADTVDREVQPSEILEMRSVLQRCLPLGDGQLKATTVCVYTNAPDGHFIVDRHPAHSQVLLASPCSGHGFKFSSAIGEVLADLLVKGASRFDLRLFRLDRFR